MTKPSELGRIEGAIACDAYCSLDDGVYHVLIGLQCVVVQPGRCHLAGTLQAGAVGRDDQVAVEDLVG